MGVEPLESRRLMAGVPAGFVEEAFVSGLSAPTSAAFAPDGRVFVTQQGGDLRVIKDGQLLPAPALSLSVDSAGERGLLGLAFDPDFTANRFVYLYYTATTPTVHNRISRFTVAGDTVVPGSERVLMDLDPLTSAANHNGGGLHFGADGKLYAGVGENANGSNAQTLANRLGKLLRINPDGSIPADNPFYNTAVGENRAIWAIGLRNPFAFAVQPGTGRILINDVGQSSWEEVNEGAAGANYGWAQTEGPTSNPAYVSPLYAYDRSQGQAITGGTFYNPPNPSFPAEYVGDYFFADLLGGYIKRLDLSSTPVVALDFATTEPSTVDLDVGPDGSLYYLQYDGALRRIRYSPPVNQAPAVTLAGPRAGSTYDAGRTYRFSARAIDPEDRALKPAALTWRVDFHHGGTVTPLVGPTAGKRSVVFRVPNTGETGTDVFYRVTVVATDSGGATQAAARDLRPRVTKITVTPSTPGLRWALDGQAVTGSLTFESVVGMRRQLSVPTPQQAPDGATYAFFRWSDGPRAADRTLTTPAKDRVLTAVFRAAAATAAGSADVA